MSLLRPLPYSGPARLVDIEPAGKSAFGTTSWLNYRDLRDQSRQMEAVGGYSIDIGAVESQDGSKSVVAPRVTANLIPLLGGRPMLGRVFTSAEEQPGGAAVALLSEGLWRQSFQGDRGVVGRTVKISGKPYMVIGVMPSSFRFPEQLGPEITNAVWLPLQPTTEMLKDRGYNFIEILGKLRPGVRVAEAQKEMDAVVARMQKAGGGVPALHATPYQEMLTGPVRPVLYALLAALVLVLLIACANVSNLLIARCLGRQQEFAVRAALGAGRVRLLLQLLSEGLLLSVLGCGVGVLFAELTMLGVHKLPEGTIPRGDSIAIDWVVIVALGAVAILVTLLSSLLPAMLVARSNPQAALQAASRGVGPRSASGKLSGWLVAGEVALSSLLLVGTGLLFHTLWNLQQSRMGFETAHITTFNATPADSAGFSSMAVSEDTAHAAPSIATLTYEPILAKIRQMPGVENAAMITILPLSGMNIVTSFQVVGQPRDRAHKAEGRITAVSGGYSDTMGTPIRHGRMISDSDVATAPPVAVINETAAKRYFNGQDPLQKQLDLGGKDTGMLKPVTIVGVLTDQIDTSVGGSIQPLILVPDQQIPTTSLFYQALLTTQVSFVVKARGQIPIAAEMRRLFHQEAPGLALDGFQTMQDLVESNTFSQRLGLYLVASFAGLAIAMVIAGLYGVLSQLVSLPAAGDRSPYGARCYTAERGDSYIATGINPNRRWAHCRVAVMYGCSTFDQRIFVRGAAAGSRDLCCSRSDAGCGRLGRGADSGEACSVDPTHGGSSFGIRRVVHSPKRGLLRRSTVTA